MGPWLVTLDEVPDPDDLALGCSVDGETVQDARTSDLIFGVPALVAELSAVLPLLPGDVIFTGTPAGIGATRAAAAVPAAGPGARDVDRGHRHDPEPVRVMTTEVILTGTGVPHPRPGRAGAGVLVRHGDVALQFDAGRATVMRLMEAGTPPHALTAVFLTHVHSDHIVGLPDVAMTRWIQQQLARTGPLVVVAAEGLAARFVRRMLEPYDDDLALRAEHVGAAPIEVTLRPFAVPTAPEDGLGQRRRKRARARRRRAPRAGAGSRRVPGRDAATRSSSSPATRACAPRSSSWRPAPTCSCTKRAGSSAMAPLIAGTVFETIFSYHADTVELGAMAARAGVPHVVAHSPHPSAGDTRRRRDVRRGSPSGWSMMQPSPLG